MTHRTALFIVGAPAVGKTTLVRGLLDFDLRTPVPMPPIGLSIVEKPKWTVLGKGEIVAAGHYNGLTFDGADTVPYNAAQAALEYWERNLRDRAQLTIFDGDRFSNVKAREWVADRVDLVRCLLLVGSHEALDQRRKGRGSDQNPVWMRGRETKARNFYDSKGLTQDKDRIVQTTDRTADEVRREVRSWLFPEEE